VCTWAARKENPNPNPNSHDHCCTEKVEMSYVCAYSSMQLDKSRVDNEFTHNRHKVTAVVVVVV